MCDNVTMWPASHGMSLTCGGSEAKKSCQGTYCIARNSARSQVVRNRLRISNLSDFKNGRRFKFPILKATSSFQKILFKSPPTRDATDAKSVFKVSTIARPRPLRWPNDLQIADSKVTAAAAGIVNRAPLMH